MHQVRKLIPEDETLAKAYRRALALTELEQRIEQALPAVKQAAEAADRHNVSME